MNRAQIEVLTRALDPYGIDGERVSAMRVLPEEALQRLNDQGWTLVPKADLLSELIYESLRHRNVAFLEAVTLAQRIAG